MKNSLSLLLLTITTSITAQVGIGTTTPAAGTSLQVVGTTQTDGFKLPTGAAEGSVLTSDSQGLATWRTMSSIGINNVVGTLTNGVNVPANTTQLIQTGNYIDLPPGKFVVNISILMRTLNVGLTPPNSSFWVKTTFSDTNTSNPSPSNDIIGGKLISGNLSGSSYYDMVNGLVLINNVSTVSKRYYFVAGRCITNSTNQTLESFGGSSTDENRIIAYRIN